MVLLSNSEEINSVIGFSSEELSSFRIKMTRTGEIPSMTLTRHRPIHHHSPAISLCFDMETGPWREETIRTGPKNSAVVRLGLGTSCFGSRKACSREKVALRAEKRSSRSNG